MLSGVERDNAIAFLRACSQVDYYLNSYSDKIDMIVAKSAHIYGIKLVDKVSAVLEEEQNSITLKRVAGDIYQKHISDENKVIYQYMYGHDKASFHYYLDKYPKFYTYSHTTLFRAHNELIQQTANGLKQITPIDRQKVFNSEPYVLCMEHMNEEWGKSIRGLYAWLQKHKNRGS